MVGITGNLCGRVRDRIGDKYGRWCGFTLLGKDGREILVLTAYNVSQEFVTGPDTLYQQQKQLYLSEYNSRELTVNRDEYIHPKKRFLKDLRTLLENAWTKRQDIVLTGDFNDVIGDTHNELTKLFLEMELIDVHAYTHGSNCDISTWTRGSHRLDYFFLSRRLIDHVLRCGFEQFYYRLSKDHRGYFVDLSMIGLFDC